ncbi:MAG: dipeptide epimerase [Armatimonadetes bacterium]|nr:dipeptide epimerase [Armatimonadota bacterium]
MQVRFRTLRLTKKYPLVISRGTSTGSNNLFVEVEDAAGHVGLGECAPGTGFDDSLAPIAQEQLTELANSGLTNMSIHQIWNRGFEMKVNPSALAAFDMALWDLLGKKCGMPLYRIFGLSSKSVPTSVTIGINPIEIIKERVPEILARTGGKFLKIKMGSPDGIHRDQENYLACLEVAKKFNVGFRVDANGGWNVEDAKTMMRWLADRGCDYVEQPLAKGNEDGLPHLFAGRPLPIYADESCHFATDVPKLAGCVDGVNLKLMKCGGLTEALRIVAAARANGLGTMIGCMGECSCAISAGAAIGELFDHIDLDSQLNLESDPCDGAQMVGGVVVPPESPGHGAWYAPDAR